MIEMNLHPDPPPKKERSRLERIVGIVVDKVLDKLERKGKHTRKRPPPDSPDGPFRRPPEHW